MLYGTRVADPDLHHFGKPHPGPDQIRVKSSDPNPEPDTNQIEIQELKRFKMAPWRIIDLQDADPNQEPH